MKNHSLKFKITGSSFFAGPLLLVLLTAPFVVSAETVVRTGSSVSIGVNQVVENDFYAAGGSVTHSGEVKEDMFVMAGSVTINGQVGQDLTVVGGTVQIHAPVGDDVRVVGGEVVIAGEVGDDVFVVGGLLKILSSARIKGNVYFYGGEVEIEGPVEGSVMGRAEGFLIDAPVSGDIDVVGNLTLADRAAVRGDVRYDSGNELVRAQNATVEGVVVRATAGTDEGGGGTNFSLFILIAWFFTTLCFFLFFRSKIERLWGVVRHKTARAGLVGLSAIVVAPILAVILIITLLGSWLGFLVLSAFGFMLLLSLVLVPIVIGRFVMQLVSKNGSLDLINVLVGIITVFVLCYVPVIGKFAIFVALALTFGALLLVLYRQIKEML